MKFSQTSTDPICVPTFVAKQTKNQRWAAGLNVVVNARPPVTHVVLVRHCLETGLGNLSDLCEVFIFANSTVLLDPEKRFGRL